MFYGQLDVALGQSNRGGSNAKLLAMAINDIGIAPKQIIFPQWEPKPEYMLWCPNTIHFTLQYA